MRHDTAHIAYHMRPHRQPRIQAPLCIRSVGEVHLRTGDGKQLEARPVGQLYWVLRGQLELHSADDLRRVGADQVALYWPGEAHALRANQGLTSARWFTFDGPGATDFLALCAWPRQALTVEKGLLPLFETLQRLVPSRHLDAEWAASSIGYDLMLRVRRGPQATDVDLAEQLRHRLEACLSDANYSIDQLAAEFHRHRASIHRLFRKRYGLAPASYLRLQRIRIARYLLEATDAGKAEVAEQCGFRDARQLSRSLRA